MIFDILKMEVGHQRPHQSPLIIVQVTVHHYLVRAMARVDLHHHQLMGRVGLLRSVPYVRLIIVVMNTQSRPHLPPVRMMGILGVHALYIPMVQLTVRMHTKPSISRIVIINKG